MDSGRFRVYMTYAYVLDFLNPPRRPSSRATAFVFPGALLALFGLS